MSPQQPGASGSSPSLFSISQELDRISNSHVGVWPYPSTQPMTTCSWLKLIHQSRLSSDVTFPTLTHTHCKPPSCSVLYATLSAPSFQQQPALAPWNSPDPHLPPSLPDGQTEQHFKSTHQPWAPRPHSPSLSSVCHSASSLGSRSPIL